MCLVGVKVGSQQQSAERSAQCPDVAGRLTALTSRRQARDGRPAALPGILHSQDHEPSTPPAQGAPAVMRQQARSRWQEASPKTLRVAFMFRCCSQPRPPLHQWWSHKAGSKLQHVPLPACIILTHRGADDHIVRPGLTRCTSRIVSRI